MAQTVFGAEYAVSVLNRAFYNTSPGNPVFNNQVKTAGGTEASQHAFAAQFAKSFDNTSNAALAKLVLVNMGVQDASLTEVQPLEAALAEYFGTVSKADRGIVVLQLGTILSGLETATGDQAEYAPAAKAWNKEIEQSFIYSANPNNAGPSNPGDGGNGGNQSAFVLTTGIDNIKASATEKSVVAIVDTNNAVSTLNAGDVINGTGVDGDVLRVILTAGTAYPGSATITDIDRIEIQAAAAANFVATGITGAKEIVSRDSTAAVTVNNIDSLSTAVGIKNSVNDLTANWEPALLNGKADAVTVTLDNATGGAGGQSVTLSAGVEVVNVKTAGAASDIDTIALAAANPLFKTLNIAAEAAVRIRDVANTVTTFDASASTAGVRLAGFGNGTEVTITGGKGDDRFTFAQDQFTAKDKIVGGEGIDRLDLSLNNTLAAKNQISGVETISVATAANASLNLQGNTDIQTIVVRAEAGGAQTVTLTNVEAPLANVEYAGEGVNTITDTGPQTFDNLTVNLAVGKGTGGSDSTAVKAHNGGVALLPANSLNLGTLTLNAIENVSLDVADGKTNLTLNDTALKALTITGNKDVTFNAALNSKALSTLDASGLSGKLTVDTSTTEASVTITLGDGNNDVTFGDGDSTKANDTITFVNLGTGNNTVREENFNPVANGAAARNGYAVIQGFDAGVGGDAFGFGALSGLTAANFAKVAVGGNAGNVDATLIVINEAATGNVFQVTGNDEVALVTAFKAWAATAGVNWDNNLSNTAGENSVVAVNGNDGNAYLFRLDDLDAAAGIQTGAGDVVELVAILSNVNAANLVLNNFVFG